VTSLAEHYELEPLSGGRSRFVWRVAYESRSRMRYVSPLLRPAVRLFMARIVKGLERYVRELPPAETASTPSRGVRAYG
jgi:hypothetical protein